MDALFSDTLSSFMTVPPQDLAFFFSFFRERKYKKNELLLREGDIAQEVYFIRKGALRQFFVNEDGLEKTCYFCFEAEFFTDLESFSHRSRATSNIIALEPTECLAITCSDLAEAMEQSTAIATVCRAIIEKVSTDNIKRIRSLISLSPESQLKELIQHKPQLLERVPQRYIAQYLGVAPESLSRIRKRMLAPRKT